MNAGEQTQSRVRDAGSWRRSLWKGPVLCTTLFMLFPLFGSLYIEGWHWRPAGFVVVATVIFSLCFVYKLITRNSDSLAFKAATAIAFFLTLALTWSSLVQWADVNRFAAIYFVVPIVELIGIAFSRLRPGGMARALFATAIAQTIAMAIVSSLLLIQNPNVNSWTGPQIRSVFGSTVVAMIFAGAALLYQKAARDESVILKTARV